MTQDLQDVLVIGGGAAGLSAALTLARARRRVLVLDDGTPRNAPAAHMHAYLGLDGLPPADLLARGRAEVEGYGGQVRPAPVRDVRREGEVFVADLADGSRVRGRRVLVATGLVDALPDVPGLAGRWGRDVLHCPFCHGWEVRDRPVAVLAVGPTAVHQALMWRQWTADVTLLLHESADPGDQDWERLAARGVQVIDGQVMDLVVEDEVLTGVRLASGRTIGCAALVVATRMDARTAPVAGLGLAVEPVEMGGAVIGTRVVTGADGATSVPGVRAAGNVADPRAQVLVAAAAGQVAAAALVGELGEEDVRAAVAARAPFSAEAERELAARLTAAGVIRSVHQPGSTPGTATGRA